MVVRHRFQPWKPADTTGSETTAPESALNLYDPDHGLTPVSRVAHIVASLREGWMHEVQVHAFARSDARLTGREVLERLLP